MPTNSKPETQTQPPYPQRQSSLNKIPIAILTILAFAPCFASVGSAPVCSHAELFAALSSEHRSFETKTRKSGKTALIIDFRKDKDVWSRVVMALSSTQSAVFVHQIEFETFADDTFELTREDGLEFANSTNKDLPLGTAIYHELGEEKIPTLEIHHAYLVESERCEPDQVREQFRAFDDAVGSLVQSMKKYVKRIVSTRVSVEQT